MRRLVPVLVAVDAVVDEQVTGEAFAEDTLTFELGASTGIGRRWETLLEVGSNFDDALLVVFSAAYRI